jgi:hypothetical protein
VRTTRRRTRTCASNTAATACARRCSAIDLDPDADVLEEQDEEEEEEDDDGGGGGGRCPGGGKKRRGRNPEPKASERTRKHLKKTSGKKT